MTRNAPPVNWNVTCKSLGFRVQAMTRKVLPMNRDVTWKAKR